MNFFEDLLISQLSDHLKHLLLQLWDTEVAILRTMICINLWEANFRRWLAGKLSKTFMAISERDHFRNVHNFKQIGLLILSSILIIQFLATTSKFDGLSNTIESALIKYSINMKLCDASRFMMKLLLGGIKGPKKIIAIDVSAQLTAVAISCASLQKAYLLKIIKIPSDSPVLIKKLQQTLLSEPNLKGIVVGKPNEEIKYKSQRWSKLVIDKLKQQCQTEKPSTGQKDIMYCFEDQTWTMVEARQQLSDYKKAIQYHGHIHGQKELEEGLASMKLLQRYLAYYNNQDRK